MEALPAAHPRTLRAALATPTSTGKYCLAPPTRVSLHWPLYEEDALFLNAITDGLIVL